MSSLAVGPTLIETRVRRRDHVAHEVGAERDIAAGLQRGDRRALDVAGRRLHVERQVTLDVDAVGAGDADVVVDEADVGRLHRDVLGAALARLEVEARRVRGRGAVR